MNMHIFYEYIWKPVYCYTYFFIRIVSLTVSTSHVTGCYDRGPPQEMAIPSRVDS